jgi:hypothetical protein
MNMPWRMPILCQDHVRESLSDPIDAWDNLIAIGNGEASARKKQCWTSTTIRTLLSSGDILSETVLHLSGMPKPRSPERTDETKALVEAGGLGPQ